MLIGRKDASADLYSLVESVDATDTHLQGYTSLVVGRRRVEVLILAVSANAADTSRDQTMS